MTAESNFSRSYVYLIRVPLVLCTISLVLMGVFAKRGYLDWRRMVHENENLVVRVATLEKQKIKLERENELLEKNTEYQENVIRQTLGFIRPNETAIEFP